MKVVRNFQHPSPKTPAQEKDPRNKRLPKFESPNPFQGLSEHPNGAGEIQLRRAGPNLRTGIETLPLKLGNFDEYISALVDLSGCGLGICFCWDHKLSTNVQGLVEDLAFKACQTATTEKVIVNMPKPGKGRTPVRRV